jgi:hypothetical protein
MKSLAVMKSLVYFRMVLWSFLGIRRNSAAYEDMVKVGPLGLLAAAAILVALLGLTLFGLANLAVSTLE